MTLFGTILKKVQSHDSITKKYSSPPPENEVITPKRKKHVSKYANITARVDSSPPALQPSAMFRHLAPWRDQLCTIYWENMKLLTAIKRQHYLRGKVDCHWERLPKPCQQSYGARVQFLKRVEKDNKLLYQIITSTKPRVASTASLSRDWVINRRTMIQNAEKKFVLFEPVPQLLMEDHAFVPQEGVTRPRVQITLGVVGAASLGELTVELFTEVCPLTCQLFLDLVDGDGLGHGYVGTCFFTKVPGLYWAGGDVIQDNGFGCYAQRGRREPIGAENYHFSHSMPGLLSMRMTRDNEMCGIFNITFKPLPQFDLRNVVFGRVIRPSSTYNSMQYLGSPLSPRPVVALTSTRRHDHDAGWVCGQPNRRLKRLR